jgi:hypothetical protein
MASQRQRSWFATPVDFLQLSLETTLSLIVRLDEFRENAMLVVYERVHLRKEAHLAIKIRGHIAIKVTSLVRCDLHNPPREQLSVFCLKRTVSQWLYKPGYDTLCRLVVARPLSSRHHYWIGSCRPADMPARHVPAAWLPR